MHTSVDNFHKGAIYQSSSRGDVKYNKVQIQIIMSPNVKSVIIAYRDFDSFNIFKKDMNIFELMVAKNQHIFEFEVNINDNDPTFIRPIYVLLIPRQASLPIYKHISFFEFNSNFVMLSDSSIILLGDLNRFIPRFIRSSSPKNLKENEKKEYTNLLNTLLEIGYISI
ncbi:hypothetical protein VNN32_04195 [Lactococcus petauri]|uniref:hypothetical protein n=1 Tax=Lactococcus petauri TaxID=1940789 RepID=UPI0030CE3741